jgi:membrane protein DedA with SNARE-associated domain
MLLVGSLGEGMPIMLFGGFAARRGWLELIPSVILVGALGNALAQAAWFFAARLTAGKVLARRKRLADKVDRAQRWLARWEAPMVIAARFVPGFGSAALLAVALSRISPARFMVLNIIGALIWAASLGALGYALGQAVEALLGDIDDYEGPIAALLVIAAAVWIAWRHALVARIEADKRA